LLAQTMLSKQREILPIVERGSMPERKVGLNEPNLGRPKVRISDQMSMLDSKDARETPPDAPSSKLTLDELTGEAIRSGFNAELIGKHLLAFAEIPDGIEKALAYAAIIIKARRARLLSSHSEKTNTKQTPKTGEAQS
jgi:hypothetical protein